MGYKEALKNEILKDTMEFIASVSVSGTINQVNENKLVITNKEGCIIQEVYTRGTQRISLIKNIFPGVVINNEGLFYKGPLNVKIIKKDKTEHKLMGTFLINKNTVVIDNFKGS